MQLISGGRTGPFATSSPRLRVERRYDAAVDLPVVREPVPPAPQPQVSARFDPELRTLWLYMHLQPRPCFNTAFLAELGVHTRRLHARRGVTSHDGRDHHIACAVIASATPGMFSLGGDLALFRDAILHRDRETLMRYGRQCIDSQWRWHHEFDAGITTIALVQGQALGGGLECALSTSILVAEESARMGLPEVRFNLFPGMGAYSFLSRKVGRRVAEEMITSGTIYTARDLHAMGVVDVLAPDGGGEAAVDRVIRERAAGASGPLDLVRHAVEPVPSMELYRIVELWVDAALKLEPRDLGLMERLVRAQNRCMAAAPRGVRLEC